MKIFKKVLTITLLIVCLTTISNGFIKIKATMSDDLTASYEVTQNKESVSTTFTTFFHDQGISTLNSTKATQDVFIFKQKQTENSKVVTWSVKNDSGKLKLTPVTEICRDYELNHPDWKVVGAINADQYVTGFGDDLGGKGKDYYYPQPYYPMICDGEGWFTISPLPKGACNVVGFLQDGSQDPLISGQANNQDIKISGMYLYILDDFGNRVQKFNVNMINETPKEMETAIWTTYNTKDNVYPSIDIKGNLFVIKKALRSYPSNSIDFTYKGEQAFNSFFGKGEITDVCKDATIGYGDFAIDTKDDDLINALSVGKKVLVQYELEGPLSTVESAIGYHTIQRMNGLDTVSDAGYNTKAYPRSIVGRTSSGEICLVSINGTTTTGAKFKEINAILKNYDIVEAYQMDGGGSVTSVLATDDGFKVCNKPSDGRPRSVLSALLVVERRKPTFEINILSQIGKDVTFEIDFKNLYNGDYNKLTFKINDVTYDVDMTNPVIKTNGLREKKEYQYVLEFFNSTSIKIYGKLTLPTPPPRYLGSTRKIIGDNYVFSLDISDKQSCITKKVLIVGDKVLELLSNDFTYSKNDIDINEYSLEIYYTIDDKETIIKLKFFDDDIRRTFFEIYQLTNDEINKIYK